MGQFKFEVLDNYMRLQEPSNDCHIRMVLEFGSSLDIQFLRRAVRRSFDVVPILGSRLVYSDGKYHWEKLSGDYADNDLVQLVTGELSNTSREEILRTLPNHEAGPQIRITVVRQSLGDTFILVVNHMAFDGVGFKEYVYLLSELYNQESLESSPGVFPSPSSRNLESIFRHLTFSQKLSLLVQQSPAQIPQRSFFSETDEPVSARVATCRIPREDYLRILNYCRRSKVTVNDLMLAMFMKAIFKLGGYETGEAIAISTMVDLRKYGPRADLRFGNFASMMRFVVDNRRRDLLGIAKEVNEKTSRLKRGFGGLKDVLLLSRLGRLLPRSLFERIITKRITSVGISSSNLGIIDSQRLRFQEAKVEYAYITTSLKKRPGLQLAFSTFSESITLSISGYYTEGDCKAVAELLTNILEDVQSFEEIMDATALPPG